VLTVDRLKLVLAVLALVGGIAAYYYLGDKPDYVRVLSILGAGTVAVIIAMQTETGRSAWEFAKGARTELRKVVWPTRKETIQVTLLVVVMIVIAAFLLWFIDWFLVLGIKTLTGKGS
jgi:preprotein translocase subunit SecE